MSRHGVVQNHIDREIPEVHFTHLAAHFENVEFLLDVMGLEKADKADVRNIAKTSTRAGMMRCFQFWRNYNPSNATYINLLEMLLKQREGEIAVNLLGVILAVSI